MEKYFIVTDQSLLNKDYFEWKENFEIIRVIVNEFFINNGIEADLYGFLDENICIEPTEKDLNKFNNVLGKEVKDQLRPFKGSSKIHKLWVKSLSENNIERKRKPYVPMYFSHCAGKMSSRLFSINNIIYCSFKNGIDFDTPDGMIEIKASEFFKIIEDDEEKSE
jgi:hypothetical protein